MPLGPQIIKHPIDDEEYANAAPTIGTLALAHFSTPEHHNRIVYEADGLLFAMYPTRRIYIRPAFRGEFDIFTTESDFQTRPMLWNLVQQMAPDHHMILPVWRGKPFWKGLQSDTEVVEVVFQMSLRQGLNLGEWHSFVSDQRERKKYAEYKEKRSKKPRVN
jgi:hypothetical protein